MFFFALKVGVQALAKKQQQRRCHFSYPAPPKVFLQGPSQSVYLQAWRLSWKNWGHGLATEAAQKVTQYGFETLGLPEILAITAKRNRRSRRVMEKLGMFTNEDENFLHPQLEHNHPLSEHVLYRFRNNK